MSWKDLALPSLNFWSIFSICLLRVICSDVHFCKWQHVVKTRSKSSKMSCQSRQWNCPVSLWCGLKECRSCHDSTEFDLHTLSPRETAQFHRLLEHDVSEDFHQLFTLPCHLKNGHHGSCYCVQKEKNNKILICLKYLPRENHIVLAIRSEFIWKASLSTPCLPHAVYNNKVLFAQYQSHLTLPVFVIRNASFSKPNFNSNYFLNRIFNSNYVIICNFNSN